MMPSAGHLPDDELHAVQQQDHNQTQHQLRDLPDAVLTAILQHVPLRPRLSACTLVCESWAAAVACTEAEIWEYPAEPDECRQMQEWLEAQGGQVSSLELDYFPDGAEDVEPSSSECSLLLPCSSLTRLTSLNLAHLRVTFHTQHSSISHCVSTSSKQPASTAHALAAAPCSSDNAAMQAMRPSGHLADAAGGSRCFLPALQELELHRCELSHGDFLQLSQLTSLTSLELQHVTLCTAEWAPIAAQQVCEAFAAVLQQLQALKSLKFADGVVLQDPVAALAPLSTMQRLQDLSLCSGSWSTASLAHLPSSMTRLDLYGYVVGTGLGTVEVTAASLPHLPLLRAANLSWVLLEPGVIAALKGLTWLSISNVLLTTPGVADAADQEQPALTAFLLELAKLTQLQDLTLNSMIAHPLMSVGNVQLLSALTASTQLTRLAVWETDQGLPGIPMPLPKGALQAMFPPPKQWPFLQTLHIAVLEADGHPYEADNWCVDAADIGCLAKCLPALSSLSLVHVVKDHDPIAALTQLLPGLTLLSVGGRVFDHQAAGLVAQLTTLRDLEWSDTIITSAGVQWLTALTNLDRLVMRDCPGVSAHVVHSLESSDWGSDPGGVELYTSQKASAAGTHDVWQQLQRRCSRDPQLKQFEGEL